MRLKERAPGESVIVQFLYGSWVEEEQLWLWDEELGRHVHTTLEEVERVLADAQRYLGMFRTVRLVKENLLWPLTTSERERAELQHSGLLAA